MRLQAFALAFAAAVTGCSSPVSEPELTAFYGVFPSDDVVQDAGGASVFTPRFRVVAASAYEPRVEQITELVIEGPDGVARRIAGPTFRAWGGDLATDLEGEPGDEPLPRGEWELLIRFADGERLLARTLFDDAPLGPVAVEEVQADVGLTVRWTGPRRAFDWSSRVIDVELGATVVHGPGGLDFGTGQTRATSFPLDVGTLDPGRSYAVQLTLEAPGTRRTVHLPLDLPSPGS